MWVLGADAKTAGHSRNWIALVRAAHVCVAVLNIGFYFFFLLVLCSVCSAPALFLLRIYDVECLRGLSDFPPNAIWLQFAALATH